MLKAVLITVAVVFVFPHSVFGIQHSSFSIDSVSAQEPPALTAPVNDFANVIDDAAEQEIDRRIRALHNATRDVVVVATVPTFQPYGDIESYAVKMFENGGRGIGERGKDNGLLIVVAVQDRRVRIETGYDLEEFITDGFAGETIRSVMTPQFARNDYGAGILAGVTRIISRIAERRGVTLQDVPPAPPPPRQRGSDFPVGLFIMILIIIFMMGGFGGRRRRRRGPWIIGGPWSGWNSGVGPFGGGGFGGGFGGFGGGGGGGGFGGFGGGGSGGGGASGGW